MTKKKTLLSDSATSQPVDIGRLVAKARLTGLRLVSSACSTPFDLCPAPSLRQTITVESCKGTVDAGKGATIKADTSTEGSTAPTAFEAIVVQISLALVGTCPDEREGLRIEATFAVVYRTDSLDEIATDQLSQFGQVVALNTVWPYWREFVQSMTARMGLPQLHLPLVRPAEMEFSANVPQADSATAARKTKVRGRTNRKQAST